MNTDGLLFQATDVRTRRMMDEASRTARAREKSRLLEAARDFEALFLKQMLDSMRRTVPKGGLIDGGFAEKIYEDMLYDEYSSRMARTADFGIARMLYDQMSRYL